MHIKKTQLTCKKNVHLHSAGRGGGTYIFTHTHTVSVISTMREREREREREEYYNNKRKIVSYTERSVRLESMLLAWHSTGKGSEGSLAFGLQSLDPGKTILK